MIFDEKKKENIVETQEIGKKNDTDEEETEIDEDKKIFNLKKVIKNFQIKILKKDKNNGDSSKNQ